MENRVRDRSRFPIPQIDRDRIIDYRADADRRKKLTPDAIARSFGLREGGTINNGRVPTYDAYAAIIIPTIGTFNYHDRLKKNIG